MEQTNPNQYPEQQPDYQHSQYPQQFTGQYPQQYGQQFPQQYPQDTQTSVYGQEQPPQQYPQYPQHVPVYGQEQPYPQNPIPVYGQEQPYPQNPIPVYGQQPHYPQNPPAYYPSAPMMPLQEPRNSGPSAPPIPKISPYQAGTISYPQQFNSVPQFSYPNAGYPGHPPVGGPQMHSQYPPIINYGQPQKMPHPHHNPQQPKHKTIPTHQVTVGKQLLPKAVVPALFSSSNGNHISKTRRRFKIKEKWFSFNNDMNITDENGNLAFKIKGSWFSIGVKMKMYDIFEKEVCKIKSEVFSFMPTYHIYQNEKKVATLKKKFQLFSFGDKFSFDLLDTPGVDFIVKGDVFQHNFSILRGTNTVARISKKFFSFADSYGVEIEPGENYVLILACCVCLDKYLDSVKASGSHG